MRKILTKGVLAFALLAATAACDDEGPAESTGDELTSEEATALAEVMAGLGYASGAGAMEEQEVQAAFVPQSHGGAHYTRTVNITAPCPRGGELEVEATLTGTEYPEEERVVVEFEGTHTHSECGVTARQKEFVVTGNPNLSWSMGLETQHGELAGVLTFDYEGGFDWSSSDGRSGTCTVDLHAEVDVEGQTSSLAGQFCGVTIESNASWTEA